MQQLQIPNQSNEIFEGKLSQNVTNFIVNYKCGNLISSFIRIVCTFYDIILQAVGPVWNLYVNILGNNFVTKTLSIKLNVCTALHGLG